MQTNSQAVVLDTNVVLDWLLFGDRSCDALGAALAARRLRWVACARMRDELADVLARGLAERRGAAADDVLAAFDRHAEIAEAPDAAPMRCTDPDDQVFIDLAVAAGARWLLSRDRALLRLARHAAPRGLLVMPPSRWQSA